MHPEYNLYHGSNLSTFRDPSPNLVLGSYYPEINDSGVHSSESSERHGSRLAWDSFEQSQISSSRSRSRLSTTTASSQENYSALLQANHKLERENLILEAKLSALEKAYSLLAQSVTPNPTAANLVHMSLAKSEDLSIPLSMVPAAEREHYPLVKFWYRHEWNTAEINQVANIGAGAQGKARAAQGENVTLKFIEDENGNIIDGFRATAMRKFARELWAGLNGVGKAPKTWGKVDAAVAAQYRNEMERKFSELRLCDNSWKADFIATLNYPSWYNNNVEKEEHLKRTSVDPPPDAKRPRAFTDGPVTFKHPPSHASHKKRTKHRVSYKGIDSPLLIHLQSSQNSPLTEDLNTPGDDSRDPPGELLGSRDSETCLRSRTNYVKAKNPLFSVPSAIPNLEKNSQASPHIFMPNEEVEISTQTTMMMEQRTVHQTATTTGVDQMVDQPALGTAFPIYFDTTTGETITIPEVDASATTAPANGPSTTAPDAPATIAPVSSSATLPPLVDALATLELPAVGLGTGKIAGIMRPNPHSYTARNLCALDWKERNPHASTTDFKHYYDCLSIEQKKMWKDREASMKTGPAHA